MNEASNGAHPSLDARSAPRSVTWRTFLRGLAVELDAQAGVDASVAVLRGVGQQMADLSPVVAVDSLEALELEMNLILAEMGWGRVQLTLLEAERCVVLVHTGMPQIGSAGEPIGTWLAPVLEGLYQGWMGQQPGADGSFTVRIRAREPDGIELRYGR